MLKMNQEVEERPTCFGDLYNGTSPECIGGHDPAFSDPETGSRVRPRCNFAGTCAVHTQANRQASRQVPGYVPVSNLTRPPQQFNQPVVPRPAWNPGYQPPTAAQPAHWQGAATQQMQPVNYFMPQYLTIRQPAVPGQSMGKRLLLESVRSIGKSLGHTISHFFDVEVFGGNRPPDRNE